MKPRIYTDTSVIGGCSDQEFHRASNALLAAFCEGNKIILVSELMLLELSKAPEKVRARYWIESRKQTESISNSPTRPWIWRTNISPLARLGRACEKMRNILRIASIERADLLVSWNFKHIVNIRRIHVSSEASPRTDKASFSIKLREISVL
uniref:PIN domain-containing protein n=1 Tax=Candidatus Kentrum sp. LFY TaxID=2126342 RepID=A0A450UTM5_9GAMM|nr:MAG: hypothetical protein BECKLFY1418A_GA0070994_10539 [Candidatus Kentron sp. LFY]